MKIAAILLAAGRSSRFGSDKLLHERDGKKLIERSAATILSGGFHEVIAVTTPARAAFLPSSGVRIIILEHGDMSDSLKHGLAALDKDTDGALIQLADMPFVTPEDIGALCTAFRAHRGTRAVIPVHDGCRGNPVILTRRLISSAKMLSGDTGARDLLAGGDIAEVPCGSGVRRDIDYLEDFNSGNI